MYLDLKSLSAFLDYTKISAFLGYEMLPGFSDNRRLSTFPVNKILSTLCDNHMLSTFLLSEIMVGADLEESWPQSSNALYVTTQQNQQSDMCILLRLRSSLACIHDQNLPLHQKGR